MKNNLIELKCYSPYYYANMVSNLLADRFAYIRTIHDLFENDGHLNFIQPFPKRSALHKFIAFCVHLDFADDLESEDVQQSIKKGDPKLSLNYALDHYDITHTTFKMWLDDREGADALGRASSLDVENWLWSGSRCSGQTPACFRVPSQA